MIRWRSRCLDVMVWSAITIHLGFSPPYRKITFLSLVALDKSIQACCLPAGANKSSSGVLIQMQEPGERTTDSLSDIEAFKGMRTPYYQCHDPPNVFLVTPRQYQFPEPKTTGQIQQPARSGFRPAPTIKSKGPGQ